MISIINALVLLALSAITIILSAKYVNGKLSAEQLATSETETSFSSRYAFNKKYTACFILIILLTGIAGYIVAQKTTYYIGLVELDCAYLVILSAAVIDNKLRIIPNLLPLVLVILRILVFIFELFFSDNAVGYFVSSLIGGFISFIVLIIADKITKGGIGMGDIKLISAIGFLCGIYTVIAVMILSLFSCAVVSVILILKRVKTRKDHLPFAPYIYIGYLVMLLLLLLRR